jgi:hypothetical protein
MTDWKAVIPGPYTEVIPQVQNAASLLEGAGSGFDILANYSGDLAAAVTAIGATRTTLIVNTLAAVANNLTVPSNITLFFTNTGGIQPANTKTVTIQGPIIAPPMKIFYNALSGQGTISFNGNRSVPSLSPKWWGAVFDGATDDTTAWNATIAAAYTLKVCKIDLPSGTSLVSNIVLPTNTTAPRISITLEGVGNPPQAFGTVLSSQPVSEESSIIESSTAGTSGVISVAGGTFQYLQLDMVNLIVRREDDPAGPGIDGANLAGMHLRNVGVDTGRYTGAVVEPTDAAGIGIIFPPIGNAGASGIEGETWVQGFYTALLAGEHLVQEGNLTLSGNKVAIEFPAEYHPMKFTRVGFFNNTRNIKVTGACPFRIDQAAVEHADSGLVGTPAWQDTVWDIDDASNLGNGYVAWHVIDAGVGTPADTFLQNGAFYIRTPQLYAAVNGGTLLVPYAEVGSGVNQSIPNNTLTNLTFDTDFIDSWGMHSTSSNTDRFICPKAGPVTLSIGVEFASNATGIRQVRIVKHSPTAGEVLLAISQVNASAATATRLMATATFLSSVPGEYFYFVAFQNSGGALNISTQNYYSPMATLLQPQQL